MKIEKNLALWCKKIDCDIPHLGGSWCHVPPPFFPGISLEAPAVLQQRHQMVVTFCMVLSDKILEVELGESLV